MKKATFLTSFLFTFCTYRAQTFNANLAAMLQDTLDTYVAAISNVKGMSACVYLPGQGYWQGTSGVSYTGQPVTSDMKFGIASNTKLFVSTTMLMLAEDHILSLDDSLHNWLPSYPNINPDITIRQLLNHTSGIPDPIFVSPWFDTINAHPTRVFTPVEVLGWVGAPLFAPGNGWYYSNVNYILAGMIAENATGFHISRLIRDSILTPLGMDSTFYDVQESPLNVIAHRWWNNVDYNDTSRVALNTAGGCSGAIFSTASEMAQWYHALFSGQLLNQSSMNELTSFVATTSPVMDYGLGLDREITQGRRYWGHGGSTPGYRSKMIYDTCMSAVVCGLTNSFPSGMEAITFLLYRTVMNHVPGCSGAITGTTTVCQGQQFVTYTIPPISNATSYVWTLPPGVTGTSNTNSITVDFGLSAVSGTIVVSGVNNYGAGGTSTLFVTVNPLPPAPVITQNTNVLTSNSPSGNQWYDANGPIAGATNTTHTVTTTGDYFCIVTLNGCSSDTSNVLHVIPTGILINGTGGNLRAYPNPVLSELVIESADKNKEATVEILNSLGEIVYSGTILKKQIIHMETFSPGIYFIRVMNEEISWQSRIIKE
jgi:D-alanyl-D-alanine carboxypeptidase